MTTIQALFLIFITCVTAFQVPSLKPNGRILRMISDNRRPLMGGNWKLNPTTIEGATRLASDIVSATERFDDVDVVIFPPFPLLPLVHPKIQNSRIKLGAQDVFFESTGAYTGAVSTNLLKEVGVTHVLIGHSERRSIFKEDDETINKKVRKVLKDGLFPVLCIGETKSEYEAGLNRKICGDQLSKDLEGVTAEEMLRIAIAYEPVWAIGTGLVCPKEVAQEVHKFIRSFIAEKYGNEIARKTIIQYGGSVNAKNVAELMSMPDIDGCLVGGASLQADSFTKIVGFAH